MSLIRYLLPNSDIYNEGDNVGGNLDIEGIPPPEKKSRVK
jgi:hypothetical protein